MKIEASITVSQKLYDECRQWLLETYGPQGQRWTHSPVFYSKNITVTNILFVDKADATFFALKWKDFE